MVRQMATPTPMPSGLLLRKRLEQHAAHRRRHASAVVPHADACGTVGQTRANTHAAAVRKARFNHRVDGVANQVEAHLLNLHRITAHSVLMSARWKRFVAGDALQ